MQASSLETLERDLCIARSKLELSIGSRPSTLTSVGGENYNNEFDDANGLSSLVQQMKHFRYLVSNFNTVAATELQPWFCQQVDPKQSGPENAIEILASTQLEEQMLLLEELKKISSMAAICKVSCSNSSFSGEA